MPIATPVTNVTLNGIPIAGPAPSAGMVLCYDATTGTARWRSPDYEITFAGRVGAGNISVSAVHAGDTIVALFDGAAAGFPPALGSFTALIATNGIVVQTDVADLNAHSYFGLVRPAFPT